jgi:hypothetical protein
VQQRTVPGRGVGTTTVHHTRVQEHLCGMPVVGVTCESSSVLCGTQQTASPA